MKKTIKAIYLLLVAIVVFTGALLIAEGAQEHRQNSGDVVEAVSEAVGGAEREEEGNDPLGTVRMIPIDDEAGSAV